MPKFYVIHYTEKGRLPRLTPEQAPAMKKAMQDTLAKNRNLKYNGTMFDSKTGIGVCDWDAPTAQAVEDVMKALGVPYDAVVPVEPLKL
jgi:hypothetical protein